MCALEDHVDLHKFPPTLGGYSRHANGFHKAWQAARGKDTCWGMGLSLYMTMVGAEMALRACPARCKDGDSTVTPLAHSAHLGL